MAGDHAGILLGLLPPIFHIREESDKAMLRWTLERMRQELRGRVAFSSGNSSPPWCWSRAPRLYLGEVANGGVGWLFALADKRMGMAITAMHKDLAHRWTLRSLAERAGMSRTSFAVKFKGTVGKSPMDYLCEFPNYLASFFPRYLVYRAHNERR